MHQHHSSPDSRTRLGSILISCIWESFVGDGEPWAVPPLHLRPPETAWSCLKASLPHQASEMFLQACFGHTTGVCDRAVGCPFSDCHLAVLCTQDRDWLFVTQSSSGSIIQCLRGLAWGSCAEHTAAHPATSDPLTLPLDPASFSFQSSASFGSVDRPQLF